MAAAARATRRLHVRAVLTNAGADAALAQADACLATFVATGAYRGLPVYRRTPADTARALEAERVRAAALRAAGVAEVDFGYFTRGATSGLAHHLAAGVPPLAEALARLARCREVEAAADALELPPCELAIKR